MLLSTLRGIELAWSTHMATALSPDARVPLRGGEDSMAKHNDKMGQPEDAIAMLKADHQRVRDLFQEYEAAQDQQAKRDIAEEAFVELEMHAQLEEQVFYPAVEDETDELGQELVEESLQEHQTVKDLIQELREMGSDAKAFDTKFKELVRNVEQHVEEEESQMFPLAEDQLADEVEELMDEMQELKKQLLAS
jgi:hemerythrin-like domain-containing protein